MNIISPMRLITKNTINVNLVVCLYFTLARFERKSEILININSVNIDIKSKSKIWDVNAEVKANI